MTTEAPPRPTAADNCAWVRARMAQAGLTVTQEELTLGEAITWLCGRNTPREDVFESLSLMMARTRPTVTIAPGWRLVRLRRGGSFTLLQTGGA